MNLIDVLLLQFCYNEEPACDKEWLRKPMLYNGFVYATNREIMIRVAPDLCGELYQPPVYPKRHGMTFAEACDQFTPLETPVRIPLASLTEVLSGIEKVTGWKQCLVCEGTGEVQDEDFNEQMGVGSGFTSGCLNCEGDGTIDDPSTLVYPDQGTAVVKLSKTFLQVKYVALLETACKMLEVDHAEVVAVFKSWAVSNVCFKVGEALIYVMSLITMDDEIINVKTYEIKLPELQTH